MLTGFSAALLFRTLLGFGAASGFATPIKLALLFAAVLFLAAPVVMRIVVTAIILVVGHASTQRHCGPKQSQNNVPTVHMVSHWLCTFCSSSSDSWVFIVSHLKPEPFILDTLYQPGSPSDQRADR
jgi:hypothetical protein